MQNFKNLVGKCYLIDTQAYFGGSNLGDYIVATKEFNLEMLEHGT
jgi:hypothetical protein